MRTYDTLRMPKHNVPVPNKDGADFWHATDGTICRSWRIAGYAHQNPDGTLDCYRCGWVTPEPVVTAYSQDTERTYLTWDDLIEAEANGVVVVGICSRKGTVPVVVGPFPDRAEARKAQARLRRKWRREEARIMGHEALAGEITTYVRVLWKEKP